MVYPTDDKENRIRNIIDGLIGTENPQDMMEQIKSTISSDSKVNIQSGKIYTFTYRAKSSGLMYDMHPLVGVTNVYNWGFTGINFHWDETRQYTWDEVIGEVYEVRKEELTDIRRIPYADLLENPSK
jgi:hypothetical protein